MDPMGLVDEISKMETPMNRKAPFFPLLFVVGGMGRNKCGTASRMINQLQNLGFGMAYFQVLFLA